MLLVHLRDGRFEELQDAFRVERWDEEYICLDEEGTRVAAYPVPEVEGFTSEPIAAEEAHEEQWKQ